MCRIYTALGVGNSDTDVYTARRRYMSIHQSSNDRVQLIYLRLGLEVFCPVLLNAVSFPGMDISLRVGLALPEAKYLLF